MTTMSTNRILRSSSLSLIAVFAVATTACSAQEPSSSEITQQDIEAVESRVSLLEAQGIAVPEDATAPTPESYMTGATLAVDSTESLAGGFAQWVLILADGLERVEFHFMRSAEEEGYSVFNIRQTNGQWLFDQGEMTSELFAAEFGNVMKFADPIQARLDLDIKILEALNVDEVAELDPKFAGPLAPGVIDLKVEGVSLYVVDGDLIVIANKGPAINNVFWAPTTYANVPASDESPPDGDAEMLAAPPSPTLQAARVCGRLYQLCMTHEDDLGLRACIAWLQYCAPKAPVEPQPADPPGN